MSSGTASILDTRPETLSFTRDLYTRSLTAKYLQKFIFFLLNFIRTMHSGEIVPSFHSAFVSPAHVALANHKARFSPCGYPSYAIRICHIWHVREVQAFPGLRARSREGRGKGFRPYSGPSGGTGGKFGWCAAKAYSPGGGLRI